jgi:hypothetical protein
VTQISGKHEEGSRAKSPEPTGTATTELHATLVICSIVLQGM